MVFVDTPDALAASPMFMVGFLSWPLTRPIKVLLKGKVKVAVILESGSPSPKAGLVDHMAGPASWSSAAVVVCWQFSGSAPPKHLSPTLPCHRCKAITNSIEKRRLLVGLLSRS